MRQFFTLTTLCALLLAGIAGCQATAAQRSAARSKSATAERQPQGDTDNSVEQVDFKADLALQPIPLPLAGETPAAQSDGVLAAQSSGTSAAALSLVGIIHEEAADDVARHAQAEGVELFEPIDIRLPATGGDADRWGHTATTEIPGDREFFDLAPAEPAAVEPVADRPYASGTAGLEFLPEPQWHVAGAHQIRAGDELEIKFPHHPLFSEKVMVQEDGLITLPLINPVVAAGLTPDQLQQMLSSEYRKLQYDPSAVRGRPVEKKYLLSVNDKLEIRFDNDDPDSPVTKLNDSVTVRPDGRISLPLVGTLLAEGKTPEELEAELKELYKRFVVDAEPVLIVREFTNDQVLVGGRMRRTGLKNIDDVVVLTRSFERLVFVGGEVQRPGFIKLTGPMTASQAIIAAGGPLRTAELRTVARFHESPDHRAVGELLNLKGQWTYEKQKNVPYCARPAVEDVLLSSNDVIVVPKTHIAKVNDALDQYVYQLLPMTRNASFQYVVTSGSGFGIIGF